MSLIIYFYREAILILIAENEAGIRLIRLPEEKANLNFDLSYGLKNKIFVSVLL